MTEMILLLPLHLIILSYYSGFLTAFAAFYKLDKIFPPFFLPGIYLEELQTIFILWTVTLKIFYIHI